MKIGKAPKKKSPTSRKISLRAVRLEEVKFTTKAKANIYPSIPNQ